MAARALAALVVVPSCWLIPEWIGPTRGSAARGACTAPPSGSTRRVLALAAVGGVWLVSVALLMANAGLLLILGALRPGRAPHRVAPRPAAAAAPQAPPPNRSPPVTAAGASPPRSRHGGRRRSAAPAALGRAPRSSPLPDRARSRSP